MSIIGEAIDARVFKITKSSKWSSKIWIIISPKGYLLYPVGQLETYFFLRADSCEYERGGEEG